MYSGQDTNNRECDFFVADGHFCEESVWAFIQVQLYGQHAVVYSIHIGSFTIWTILDKCVSQDSI